MKQTEPAVPGTPSAPNPPHADTAMDTYPANTPVGDPSATTAASGVFSTAAGAAGSAAAAAAEAIHPDPVPAKPQDSFVPPREQIHQDSQPVHEEALKENWPGPSSLKQEAEQAFPHSDSGRKEESARGGTGPKYEPDKDLKSMFLRYDNRLNRKRYLFRGLALGAAVSIITKLITMIAVSMHSSAIASLGTVISVAAAIPSFMLMIRRLHDLNRPAWWCIGVFVPLVNLVLGIYLLFFKGTDGPNDYGPDPLEVPGGLL